MRCREVRRRLNNAGDLDPEILEHLKGCRDCAREYEASRALDSMFEAARGEETLTPTPFSRLKSGLEQLSPSIKENSIMAKMKNEITRHPKFSFGIGAAISLFAFVLLVPVSYEKTVGYELAISGINAEDSTDREVASDVVKAMGYGEAAFSFEVAGNLVNLYIKNLPSEKAAKEISSAISSLMRSVPDIVITPIIARASGSIYAQVKDKMDLKIVTEDKSDNEVKEEIEEGLKKRGYKNPRVIVESDSVGQRRIKIENRVRVRNSEKFKSDNKAFESTERMEIVVDENGKAEITIPVREQIYIDTKDKTNEQIKEELEKKLAEKGMKNPRITIKDLPDGKREINIEVEEENKKD